MVYLDYINFHIKKSTNPNYLADHFEFFCFLSKDKTYSIDDFVDRLIDNNVDTDAETTEEVLDPAKDEIDKKGVDDIVSNSSVYSRKRERLHSKSLDVYDYIKSRARIYGKDYPFRIEKRGSRIYLKNRLTDLNKLYLILLTSSLLHLATSNGVNKLGHHFEELCGPVFKKLIPTNSKFSFFGAGNQNQSQNKLLYDKISNLSKNIYVNTTSHYSLKYVGEKNYGDGGLDWLAYKNFSDKQSHQPIIFGQCACGKDWIEKQFDANRQKWANYIEIKSYLIYHFIPYNFRDKKLNWYNPLKIFDVVLIDRYRIMELFKMSNNAKNVLAIYKSYFQEIKMQSTDVFT